jgi:sensor c-di-GMP phosphodiesterase-like protein
VYGEPIQTIETLNSLNEPGLSIAIEDFDTGYSSLSYLTELPIDTLKIEMS